MPPTGARSTIAAGAAAVLLLAAFIGGASLLSIDLQGLLPYLYWAVVIALLLVIAVRAKQWAERYPGAAASPNAAADLEALRQSLERIEKKVDATEEILAKVAE